MVFYEISSSMARFAPRFGDGTVVTEEGRENTLLSGGEITEDSGN
jgi:hypothetical protein